MNEYSKRWFGSFLETIPADWTRDEVDGICRRIPLPAFRTVLDVCCGPGRHAALLAESGYAVTGVDRDRDSLATAARRVPHATFIELDQRDLSTLEGTFDAAMILWQSFGYFDPATNDRVLRDLAALLRERGRLLLDFYHPGHFRAGAGAAGVLRAPGCRAIANEMLGDRLRSTITYEDGDVEVMEFELSEPYALAARGEANGLRTLETCCWWDELRPATPTEARYQIVFERAP